jgi:hypothetical protein
VLAEMIRRQIKSLKFELSCWQLARGSGHSSYVGALALSDTRLFSGSKDGVLKMWKRPELGHDSDIQELSTLRTVLAHSQVIYAFLSLLHMFANCILKFLALTDYHFKLLL